MKSDGLDMDGVSAGIDFDREIELHFVQTKTVPRSELNTCVAMCEGMTLLRTGDTGPCSTHRAPVGLCSICRGIILADECHLDGSTDRLPDAVFGHGSLVCSVCIDMIKDLKFFVVRVVEDEAGRLVRPTGDLLKRGPGEVSGLVSFWQAAEFIDQNQSESEHYCLCCVRGDGQPEVVRFG